MAQDTKPHMPAGQRHVYGPRAVGALVPGLTRAAYRRRAPATAQVFADWATIVGPALARVTHPRRLHGGTLAIACAGPVAMELQHLTPELLARINAHLGRPVVQRLRFVQDAPPRVSESLPAAPSPVACAAADRAVACLPAGELRDALASLGRVVLDAPPESTPTARDAKGDKPARKS